MNLNKKGVAATTVCYVMWGFLTIFWKQLSDVNAYYLLAVRIVWATGFCFLLLCCLRQLGAVRQVLRNRRALLLTALAGVFVTINWGSFIIAVNAGHVLQSSLGYYINPLFVILLSTIFFGEKLAKGEWAAIGLAAAGVLVMVVAKGVVPTYALIISGSFVVYGAIKKVAGIDSQVSLFLEVLIIFPLALFYMIFADKTGAGSAVMDAGRLWLLPMAGLVTAVPYLLYGYGVNTIPYSIIGIFQFINPTIQLLVGTLIYHEAFTRYDAVTFCFVWVAVFIFLRARARKDRALRKAQE